MASRRKEFFPEVTDEQWNDWQLAGEEQD